LYQLKRTNLIAFDAFNVMLPEVQPQILDADPAKTAATDDNTKVTNSFPTAFLPLPELAKSLQHIQTDRKFPSFKNDWQKLIPSWGVHAMVKRHNNAFPDWWKFI
jgi:hypothetical protein